MIEPLRIVHGSTPLRNAVVHFRNAGSSIFLSKAVGENGLVYPPPEWTEAEVRARGFEPTIITYQDYLDGKNREDEGAAQ